MVLILWIPLLVELHQTQTLENHTDRSTGTLTASVAQTLDYNLINKECRESLKELEGMQSQVEELTTEAYGLRQYHMQYPNLELCLSIVRRLILDNLHSNVIICFFCVAFRNLPKRP